MAAWLLVSPDMRRRNGGPEGGAGDLLGHLLSEMRMKQRWVLTFRKHQVPEMSLCKWFTGRRGQGKGE